MTHPNVVTTPMPTNTGVLDITLNRMVTNSLPSQVLRTSDAPHHTEGPPQREDPGAAPTARGHGRQPWEVDDMPKLRAHTRPSTPGHGNVANRRPRTTDTSRTREDRIGERITVQPDGCWTYDGGHNPAGYAVNQTSVHRIVYEILVGPIPDGHHLHHHCGNRGCVRPSHLEPLTPSEHSQLHADQRAS